jgi:hypothetical protein
MKYLLLTAVATTALISGSAYANDHDGGRDHDEGGLDVDVDLEFSNEIDTSIETDVAYTKDVALIGGALVLGVVPVDSSAVAVNDVKQLQQGVAVTYREENELNGENGYVDPVFGPGWSEAGADPNDQLTDGVLEGQIRAGFFAPIINTVDTFDVSGDGNIGLNMAAGYFNEQLNSAVLATSDNDAAEAAGGWAEASTTSLQSLLAVGQYATPGDILDEDDPQSGGGENNFRDRNTIAGGTIGGSGNIGVNAAAGSLNQQANLLTIAVANDTTLAEANAGLVQAATLSGVQQQDSINLVTGPVVTSSGNVGVNFAAGVGNQQLNSLTIAASQAGTPVSGGSGAGDPS